MSIDTLKETTKAIIQSSTLSFTTSKAGFGGIELNHEADKDELDKLRQSFKQDYMSTFGMSEEEINKYVPLQLMFHVFGITSGILSLKEWNDNDFITKLIIFYRQCGVKEIIE